jgi:hypothetical protein
MDLIEYVRLIEQFVSGEITAPQFEERYLQLVKTDQVLHGEPAFGIVDTLFFYVDEYFDDPDFTPEQRAQATDELRQHAREALSKLLDLPAKDDGPRQES